MQSFRFFEKDSNKKILCIGSHPDDIEIGCGGTILKILIENRDTQINWVVLSGDEERRKEAEKSVNSFIPSENLKKFEIKNFQESYFPHNGASLKEYFEELKKQLNPEIIFTHYGKDFHQDHRTISELTWNTFRDNLILEYEIPKYDGDLGNPNLYVNLENDTVETKLRHIITNFKTQTSKRWFTEDTFKSILRLRGMESNSPSRYAEAFYCRKIVF